MCNYNEVNSCQSTYRYTQQFGGVNCRNSRRSPPGMPAVSRMGGEMSEREMPRGERCPFPPTSSCSSCYYRTARRMSVPVYYYTRADVRLVYDLSAVTVCSLLGYGALRNWPDWYRHRRIWGGRPCPLELGPSKFQERPSGPSGMQENLLAAGALPEPHWGDYSAPQTR